MSEETKVAEGAEGLSQGLSGLQKVSLGLFSTVLVGSVAARAATGGGGDGVGDAPPGALGLVPTEGGSEPEPGFLESSLPFLTEGSLFALLGFAVGYATRKLVKLLLILVALAFVGLQLLANAGIAEVDWGQALEVLNDLVLNVREERPISSLLKDKVPTTGAFAVGLFLGFRRG